MVHKMPPPLYSKVSWLVLIIRTGNWHELQSELLPSVYLNNLGKNRQLNKNTNLSIMWATYNGATT